MFVFCRRVLDAYQVLYYLPTYLPTYGPRGGFRQPFHHGLLSRIVALDLLCWHTISR